MQRISLGLPGDDNDFSNHFQRGSLDTITLNGSNMGDLEALWIGIESGSWRMGGLRLTIIDTNQWGNLSKDDKNISPVGSQYDFEVDDVFLGDGGSTSIVELRHKLCTKVSIDDVMCLMNYSNKVSPSPSLSDLITSTTQGLKEYEDLKLSLLIYDVSLVSIGAVCLTCTASESSSLVFLAGGLTGFLYLLSLQKSVDGLPNSKLLAKGGGESENPMQILRGINGPLSRLVLVVSGFVIVFKFGLGGSSMNITPQDLLFATLGFFTCKVAVLFAAFKPFTVNSKED